MKLRPMRESDLDTGVRLCRAAGWNQLRADWEAFYRGNPGGCFVAELAGDVVGTVTTTNYENKVGWVAMVLVDPLVRGRGIGTALLEAALESLSGCECIKLDATPSGREVYRKLGFQDEYGLLRVTTEAASPVPAGSVPVRAMNPGDLDAVATLDRGAFGVARPRLVERLLCEVPALAHVACDDTGAMAGFVLGRHGYHFSQVGPLVAICLETAQALAIASLAASQSKPFALDIPTHTPAWAGWLKSLGFTAQRPFTRMYKGTNAYPGIPGRTYAISGPELG